MRDSEDNTFNMVLATDKNLDDIMEEIKVEIPVIEEYSLDLKDLIGKVRDRNLIAIEPLTGFTLETANFRNIMCEQAITIGGGLEGYFKSIKDFVKKKKAHLTESQLKAATDTDVEPMCRRMVKLANPYAERMGAFGVVQSEVGELGGSCDNYFNYLDTGRNEVAKRSAAGETVTLTLQAILVILYLLDDVMKTIRISHPEEYAAWLKVRMTIDRHASATPVTKAAVILPGQTIAVHTSVYDPEQLIKFNNLHPTLPILIGLSTVASAFSTPPRVLNADSISTLLSSTLAPDGDYIVFQNTSEEPISIELTILD